MKNLNRIIKFIGLIMISGTNTCMDASGQYQSLDESLRKIKDDENDFTILRKLINLMQIYDLTFSLQSESSCKFSEDISDEISSLYNIVETKIHADPSLLDRNLLDPIKALNSQAFIAYNDISSILRDIITICIKKISDYEKQVNDKYRIDSSKEDFLKDIPFLFSFLHNHKPIMSKILTNITPNIEDMIGKHIAYNKIDEAKNLIKPICNTILSAEYEELTDALLKQLLEVFRIRSSIESYSLDNSEQLILKRGYSLNNREQ